MALSSSPSTRTVRSSCSYYPGNQDPHKSLQPIRSSNSRSRLPRDQRSTTESTEIHGKEETIATLPGGWDLAHAIRLGIKPLAELGANSEALSGSQVDSPCSCRAIFESAPVAMLQSRKENPNQLPLSVSFPGAIPARRVGSFRGYPFVMIFLAVVIHPSRLGYLRVATDLTRGSGIPTCPVGIRGTPGGPPPATTPRPCYGPDGLASPRVRLRDRGRRALRRCRTP